MRSQYGAFHEALKTLYQHPSLAAAKDSTPTPPDFDDTAFFSLADLIHSKGGFDVTQLKSKEARRVIEETASVINAAVSSSLPEECPDTLRYALEENAFIFSGFKTFHTMREIGLSMVTDKGTVKPYEDFKKDVQAINSHYNTNYLHAEYYHALGSAQMAVQWQQVEKDGDRYDLQYRTAEDDHVRETHRLLNGITLPPSDPFWDKYYPPNGWGCRCNAVQVPKGKYPLSDPELAMKRGDNCTDTTKQKIFRFNPGKTMTLFPPKHPYYKVPAETKGSIINISQKQKELSKEEIFIEEMPDNLTQQEKIAIAKNCIEIEDILKRAKGKPMDINKADRQSANPNHVLKFLPDDNGTYRDDKGNTYIKNPTYSDSKHRRFAINCQTCAPAYMLRLRGFELTAKGNTPGSLSEYLSKQRSFEAWKNADGSQCQAELTENWMKQKGYKQMTPKRYKEYFEQICKEEGVYLLTIGWKGGGGHATILQRLNNGKLVYIEPQVFDPKKGAERSIEELCIDGATKPKPTRGILRIDNKVFNTDFLSIFD